MCGNQEDMNTCFVSGSLICLLTRVAFLSVHFSFLETVLVHCCLVSPCILSVVMIYCAAKFCVSFSCLSNVSKKGLLWGGGLKASRKEQKVFSHHLNI